MATGTEARARRKELPGSRGEPVPSPDGGGSANGRALIRSTVVRDDQVVHIPAWVTDHDSFRRWARSDDFPEKIRVCYLAGEVWVDMSNEQFFTHNQVKGEFNRVLANLAKLGRLGRFVPDGMLLSNVEASLSAGPDGAFVTRESLDSGRIRLVEGKREGYVELEGTPEMVLEVVSPGSVTKDTVTLRELYWRAGIREFWLVDVRGERLVFDILRHGAGEYTATRKQKGWVKSAVFGKSFRLTRQTDERGDPEYTLEVR
jgi:Uma2 family endonuclease